MKKLLSTILSLTALFLLIPMTVFAEGAAKVETGDTTFIMLSSALVFIMTPALAFFYGGMARKKNLINTLFSSFIIIGLISIQWVLFGYSLSFGPDKAHFIGGLDWLGFTGVGFEPNADYAATVPHTAFAFYQLMFAIITAALITGSIVERMKFGVLIVFILLWSTLVYDPLAHMVWGVDGYLRNLGALDFAGGTVVHISSGVAGLVAALVLGKRKGFRQVAMIPNNIPYVLLGGAFLWMGWFGFNGGSALTASGLAFHAIFTTNTAAAAASLSWVAVEWIKQGKPTLLGAVTGSVVGLVVITPAAGFVPLYAAIIMGLVVSPICYFFVSYVKAKLGYDDSLDAFGCHGIGGIVGALLTGVFASPAVNSAGTGLVYGNAHQVWVQFVSVVITVVLSGVATFVILKVISIFTPLRVTEQEEKEGLDISLHNEEAYPAISE